MRTFKFDGLLTHDASSAMVKREGGTEGQEFVIVRLWSMGKKEEAGRRKSCFAPPHLALRAGLSDQISDSRHMARARGSYAVLFGPFKIG